jgi:hypothetical protein
MKVTRVIAIVLVILALLLTGIGGMLDAWRDGVFVISKQHAWHDGMFLTVLAIFLLLL